MQNEKAGFPGSRTLALLERTEFGCGQPSGEVLSTAGAGSCSSLLFQACRGMQNANPSLIFSRHGGNMKVRNRSVVKLLLSLVLLTTCIVSNSHAQQQG